ncbi:hypothetical protein HGD85_01550, partial [Rhodobacteraceae bacterium R_SAG10]|nr:hypothetical protein [Rhodobacteraceae bacterium R_SAG10]
FSGLGSENFAEDEFASLASLALLGGGRVSSVFVGPHAFAVFNIVAVGLLTGALRDSKLPRTMKMLSWLVLGLTIFGGLLSTSKVFFFGILVFGLGILVTNLHSLRSMIGAIVMAVAALVLVFYLASEIRVLGNLFSILLEGDWWRIFETRFGKGAGGGYFQDVQGIIFHPFTLIFGQGGQAGQYKYSDFEYRQVMLVGGIPLFIMFYALFLYLQVEFYRRRKTNPYAIPFFLVGLVLLIAATGIGTHLQGRSITLWQLLGFIFCHRYASPIKGAYRE